MDLGGALRTAEDFLRRHIKSKAVRDAERRRKQRRQQAFLRRARNALLAGGASGAGGFGVATALAPTAALLAGGAAAVVGLAAVGLWSRQRSDRLSRLELTALPGEAEDWLLDKRPLLPRGAEPALDMILVDLADLPPFLALLHPNETLAWDTRRLLGDHLPNLVDAWCGLPTITREGDSDARRRLVEGLATLAEELSRLTEELSRDERMRLETRSRFVESRYKDPETGV